MDTGVYIAVVEVFQGVPLSADQASYKECPAVIQLKILFQAQGQFFDVGFFVHPVFNFVFALGLNQHIDFVDKVIFEAQARHQGEGVGVPSTERHFLVLVFQAKGGFATPQLSISPNGLAQQTGQQGEE